MRYILTAIILAAAAFAAAPAENQDKGFVLKSLVEDGFSIAGVEGSARPGAAGKYMFYPDTDIEGKDGVAFAGTGLEILKCRLLEDIEKLGAGDFACKVSGVITKCSDTNYILLNLALPLAKEEAPEKPAEATEPAEQPAGDDGVLPDDIFSRLSQSKAVDSKKAEKLDNVSPNKVVTELVGRFKQRGEECRFVPEARGAKTGTNDFEVLPCGLLEDVPAMSRTTPSSPKFRIAGIETEYKGKKYILLQRVVRKYSYGNLSGI